jgi:hypothetical protein
MKNTFDKARQKNRPKRKEFKVRYKFFGTEFYINPLLIPVACVVGTVEYLDNKYYESLEWSDEKATKLLNRTLPYVLEWVEEDNAYYYCMNWGSGYFNKKAPIGYRRWGVKFYSDIIDFIRDGYENPNYRKTVEKDEWGDTWVKFEEYNYINGKKDNQEVTGDRQAEMDKNIPEIK